MQAAVILLQQKITFWSVSNSVQHFGTNFKESMVENLQVRNAKVICKMRMGHCMLPMQDKLTGQTCIVLHLHVVEKVGTIPLTSGLGRFKKQKRLGSMCSSAVDTNQTIHNQHTLMAMAPII